MEGKQMIQMLPKEKDIPQNGSFAFPLLKKKE